MILYTSLCQVVNLSQTGNMMTWTVTSFAGLMNRAALVHAGTDPFHGSNYALTH